MPLEVQPEPALVVHVATELPATRRSFAFVVVSEPEVLSRPLPDELQAPSRGEVGSIPLYSRTRTSGNGTSWFHDTVTVFDPAETLLA
jgi:hypothetical protein